MSSGSVRRRRSTLGRHTWCVCVSLACGREEETGWACSEDTLWEEGWAAGCECFGSSGMEARSSGSGRGRGRCVLPAEESSGGLWRWVESPEGWSCREDEGCKVGRVPWGSWRREAGRCMTRMYSWAHPVWALSRQTCTPDAVPCLSCRGSQWDPGQGCWRGRVEEEGRRRGDSKTRPRSVSYRRRVSCTGAGGFPTGSSPPLQRDTEKRFFFQSDANYNKWELQKFKFKKLRREHNVHMRKRFRLAAYTGRMILT